MLSQDYPSPGLTEEGRTARAAAVLPDASYAAQPANAPVLIVEDEHSSRAALSRLLARSGYPNRAVATAEEALQLIRSEGTPRAALVDLNLPGMSGLDLIGALSEMDPSVTIVLITAMGGERLRAALRERGVGYLRKPLDFDRLLGMLGGGMSN